MPKGLLIHLLLSSCKIASGAHTLVQAEHTNTNTPSVQHVAFFHAITYYTPLAYRTFFSSLNQTKLPLPSKKRKNGEILLTVLFSAL